MIRYEELSSNCQLGEGLRRGYVAQRTQSLFDLIVRKVCVHDIPTVTENKMAWQFNGHAFSVPKARI